ncbi:MAG: type VI secretion protein IcmF/TssM N-terminal domain-containing protein, partial [Planctomycetota bacterium]
MASSKTIKIAGAAVGAVVLLLVLILMFASGSLFLIILAGLVVVGACVGLFFLALRWHDQRVALRAEEVSGEVDREDPMARIMELRKSFNEGILHFSSFQKSIYSLPWYVIVGEKGAGKTEAIRHSGLGFPPGLHDEVDRVRMGIGGDGTLNWWFTNQAVMLDTVGEWLFKEEDEDPALSEWGELCRLLASRRPRSPVNGMVLALSVENLLKDSEEETKAKAERLSRKLAQAQQVLEIRFPIFVMVTKCDRIIGFREFFGLTLPEERQQMLGWSNPSPLDEAFDPNVVEEHLQNFFSSLRRRRLELLSPAPMQEMASKSQSGRADAAYTFPGNLARVAPRLRTYLETVFLLGEWRTTPLFLRGIYFTSSLQEGPVLDQEVHERFGLPEEVTLKGEDEKEEEDDLERSYFLHDFFAGKVAQEKGLVLDAGSARSSRRIRRALLWAFGLASVSLLIVLTWLSSYTLQEELGNERSYWEMAAEAGHWKDIGGRWAWRPVISPVPGGRGQFLYAGAETFDIEGSEFTTGSFLGEIAGRVEKPMRLPWTFRFTARIEGGLGTRRLLAARALFESSVLRPLLAAAVERMSLQAADHWRPEATDALEQLMRLALAAGGADAGGAGDDLVALDPLFRYVLLSAPADYETYARDHSKVFAEALTKLYGGSHAGAWPPESLDVGGKKTRQALRKGVASFAAYWANQMVPGRTSRFFARASSLAAAGEDFLRAEEGLAELAGAATGATPPASLVGHNMVAGEWGRHFALLSAAREEIRRDEKLLKSGTLQEAYQQAGTSALSGVETAFKRIRDIVSAAAAGGREDAAEIPKLASELDGTLKAQLGALRKASKRGMTPERVAGLDSRVFAPIGGQAFARKAGRACQYRFETYALANKQLVARTEAGGVFELAKELAAARAAIAGCRANVKKRAEPPEPIPLAAEAARTSLFACDLAERGRTFVLLKGALDNVRDAPGGGRLDDLVRRRAKTKGFAAIQKPAIPLTRAGERDFDQRYNREAAAGLLAGREAVVSALGLAKGDPKKVPSTPGGAILERDELRKEYELLKGALDGYFVSYLSYWLDTLEGGLAVRAPAGGDFFGELTKVVPWKTNKGIGSLVDVVHQALSGFDVAADPVLTARVK